MNPKPPEITVSFIQRYPTGKGSIQTIPRPEAIGLRALTFLAAGGWYIAEILTSGGVKLSATDANMRELVTLDSSNSPELLDAVDALINRSQAFLGLLTAQRAATAPITLLTHEAASTLGLAN
jgi:hypothetical protein